MKKKADIVMKMFSIRLKIVLKNYISRLMKYHQGFLMLESKIHQNNRNNPLNKNKKIRTHKSSQKEKHQDLKQQKWLHSREIQVKIMLWANQNLLTVIIMIFEVLCQMKNSKTMVPIRLLHNRLKIYSKVNVEPVE